MGFGGAFAPNSFERISTLAAAWVQRKQAAFNATQPLPAGAQRWAEARAAAQRAGTLQGGAEQTAPRYLQVYIDDFTGVALTDTVAPPAEVMTVHIDPVHTAAGDGTPARPNSRVHVHAQLAVLGLAELSLHAAAAKVTVGDPVTALGFSLGVTTGRLRCPGNKRTLLLADI
eukprot:5200231-Pleurochrysis_carterae.AAC.1